jgi:N-acyl-D-amino-acid deacylase
VINRSLHRPVHIKGATLVDGTGAPRRRADLLLSDGRVEHIGPVSERIVADVIAADGLIVAPGFVDHHQHGDITPLVDPRCMSALAQGVTSIVVGNCGHGVAPQIELSLADLVLIGYRSEWGITPSWSSYLDYFAAIEKVGPSINIGAFAAHGALRMATLGSAARHANDNELRRMEDLVEEAMSAGAFGFSSGLEYSPGMYADTEELLRLCRVVAKHDGSYATHVRNRAAEFVDAVAEAISIAERAGVRLVLSHLAPRPYAPPDSFDRVLEILESARARGVRITIDTFPDIWGPSPLASLIPARFLAGGAEAVARRLRDPKVRDATARSFDQGDNFLLRCGPLSELRLTSSTTHRENVGMTLAQIAEARSQHPGETVCDLLADEGADLYSVLIQHRYATASALEKLMLDEHCAFESDGVVASADGALSRITMNRSTYGYAPRVLGELVRERGLLTLEEAIRKMTSLPADAVGIRDRGRLVEGAIADVVVFDEATVADATTDMELQASPRGIVAVVVGGRPAIHGRFVDPGHAGQVLRLVAQ